MFCDNRSAAIFQLLFRRRSWFFGQIRLSFSITILSMIGSPLCMILFLHLSSDSQWHLAILVMLSPCCSHFMHFPSRLFQWNEKPTFGSECSENTGIWVIHFRFVGYSHHFPTLETTHPFFSAWPPPIISDFLDVPRGDSAFSGLRGLYSQSNWDHFLFSVSAIHCIAFEIARPVML
jgi:hypothetical protein